MKAHTPKPWKANPCGFIHGGPGLKTLIACPPTVIEAEAGIAPHPQSEEAKANALLLAAAPELLEALGRILLFACEVSRPPSACLESIRNTAIDLFNKIDKGKL